MSTYIKATLKCDTNDRPHINLVLGQLNVTIKKTKTKGLNDYITVLMNNRTELNILLTELNKVSFWGVIIHKTKIKNRAR